MFAWFSSGGLLLQGPITDPVPVFLVMLAAMLLAPLVFERLKLPGMVGLIFAGAVIGPHGLGLLQRSNAIILFGTVGILWLMFMAGLETSPGDLRRGARLSLVFGVLTFAVPMVLGTATMAAVGYSVLASVLLASCFASHTLLALPLVLSLGIVQTRAVAASLGATLVTNVLALLVLAVVVRAHLGELSAGFWFSLAAGVTVFTVATLGGVPRVGRWFFRRFGHDEVAEFSFVLTTLFLVSYGAEWVQVEPIVGAFLAGTAITDLIPRSSPLMHRIEFMGNSLFIPIFLISVGMLVDLKLLLDLQAVVAALAMVGALFLSKYIAAAVTGKAFGLEPDGVRVMFGLTVAQAASTLAAATVAFEIDLIDEATINGVIIMIVASCVASPWAVARWGDRLKAATTDAPSEGETAPETVAADVTRILVPVANPATENNLIRLAIALLDQDDGVLLPIQVAVDQGEFPPPDVLERQRRLLKAASDQAHAASVKVEPIARIDGAVDRGIVRAAVEHRVDLIVVGWKGYATYREHFFGSMTDLVAKRSPVPVLVTRLTHPVQNTRRVILAFSDWNVAGAIIEQEVALCARIAEQLKATLTIAHALRYSRLSARLEPVLERSGAALVEEEGSLEHLLEGLLQPEDLLVLSTPVAVGFGSVTAGQVERLASRFERCSLVVMCHPASR